MKGSISPPVAIATPISTTTFSSSSSSFSNPSSSNINNASANNDDDNRDLESLDRLFQRYHHLKEEASVLEEERRAFRQVKQEHDAVQDRLVKSQNDVQFSRDFQKEQRDRIELVSTHWFFGTTLFQPQLWFRGGCTGKIERAHIKLEKAEREFPVLQRKLQNVERELEVMITRCSGQQSKLERAQQAKRECDDLKRDLIEEHKTILLEELDQEGQHLQYKRTSLETKHQDYSNVDNLLREGKKNFQLAATSLERSLRQWKEVQELSSKEELENEIWEDLMSIPPRHRTSSSTRSDGEGEVISFRSRKFHFPVRLEYDQDGTIVSSNRPCFNRCGRAVTWNSRYCCMACANGSNRHHNHHGHHHHARHSRRHHPYQHDHGMHGPRCRGVQVSDQNDGRNICDKIESICRKREEKISELESSSEKAIKEAQDYISKGRTLFQRVISQTFQWTQGQVSVILPPIQVVSNNTASCACSGNKNHVPETISQMEQIIWQYMNAILGPQESIMADLLTKSQQQISLVDQEQRLVRNRVTEERERIFSELEFWVVQHRSTQGSSFGGSTTRPPATAPGYCEPDIPVATVVEDDFGQVPSYSSPKPSAPTAL